MEERDPSPCFFCWLPEWQEVFIIVPSRLHKPVHPASAFKFDMIWPNSKSTLSSRKCWIRWPQGKWDPTSVNHQKLRVCFRTPMKMYPWVVAETGWILKSMLEKIDFPISLWCQQVDPCEYAGVEFLFKWPEIPTPSISFGEWEGSFLGFFVSYGYDSETLLTALFQGTELGQRGQLATWGMNNPPDASSDNFGWCRRAASTTSIWQETSWSSSPLLFVPKDPAICKDGIRHHGLKKRSLCTQRAACLFHGFFVVRNHPRSWKIFTMRARINKKTWGHVKFGVKTSINTWTNCCLPLAKLIRTSQGIVQAKQ